ncbi:MAG: hypothetical protein QW756_01930 [Nitrososphaerota archaeon]
MPAVRGDIAYSMGRPSIAYIRLEGLYNSLGLRVRVYWKPTCQTCRHVVKGLRAAGS